MMHLEINVSWVAVALIGAAVTGFIFWRRKKKEERTNVY